MAKFKVVILPHSYPSTDIEREIITQAGGEMIDGDTLSNEESAFQEAEDADAILVRWTKITPELLRRFKRCRIVVRYGIGYDNVDYGAATSAGIIISHCTTYSVDEVSTHALALLLGCVRDVAPTHQRITAGIWNDNPPTRQWRMAGRTLGVVGLGNIGRAFIRKVGGWRMRLLASDPYVPPELAAETGVEMVDLQTLCRESDYISLHPPLLPETNHLLGQKQMGLMKPGVILINTARGPVLDEKALADALDQGKVGAAGIDVFEREPLPMDSRLRHHPRVLLSDHAAWYSEDSLAELRRSVAQAAARFCTGGLPVDIANPEVLEQLGRATEWKPNYNATWRARRAEKLSREPAQPVRL